MARIGDEMKDGTILGGYFEGRPFYTTPKDEQGTFTFNQAFEHARASNAHNHKDWQPPNTSHLKALWKNRNKGKLAGTFNETNGPAGWYWSCESNNYDSGRAQTFSNGVQLVLNRITDSSLRCVR